MTLPSRGLLEDQKKILLQKTIKTDFAAVLHEVIKAYLSSVCRAPGIALHAPFNSLLLSFIL